MNETCGSVPKNRFDDALTELDELKKQAAETAASVRNIAALLGCIPCPKAVNAPNSGPVAANKDWTGKFNDAVSSIRANLTDIYELADAIRG